MNVKVQVLVQSSKERVWNIITDIEKAASTIRAIDEIVILEPPSAKSIIGLKWKETRTLFGKSASEIMWITDSVQNVYYTTRAESHGSIYKSKLSLAREGQKTLLTMEFKAKAETRTAKIMSFLMGFMMKGANPKGSPTGFRRYQRSSRKNLIKEQAGISLHFLIFFYRDRCSAKYKSQIQ